MCYRIAPKRFRAGDTALEHRTCYNVVIYLVHTSLFPIGIMMVPIKLFFVWLPVHLGIFHADRDDTQPVLVGIGLDIFSTRMYKKPP